MECSVAEQYYNTHIDPEVVRWNNLRNTDDPGYVLTSIRRTNDGEWYEYTRAGIKNDNVKEDITPLTAEHVRKLFSQRRLNHLTLRFFPAAEPASPVTARPELHRSKRYEGLRGTAVTRG